MYARSQYRKARKITIRHIMRLSKSKSRPCNTHLQREATKHIKH